MAFVVGARPNYMKVAPILREFDRRDDDHMQRLLIHTGQHYDAVMNQQLFSDLGMRAPDEMLNVGSDTHAKQTAKIMIAFDDVCDRRSVDIVVVVGDVNSTIACALVAAKRGIRIVHVEAGLRSFDRTMPEEVNRILTDQLSDLLLTPSPEALDNLVREGIDASRVRFVGNPMIDSLEAVRPLVESGTRPGHDYGVITLHRPSNVDSPDGFLPIFEGLSRVARRIPLYFPVHPRTAARLQDSGLSIAAVQDGEHLPTQAGLWALPPLGYIDFLRLIRWSRLVLTDSGGVQEETTVFGVPCATLRPNTERPVTVTIGTNRLTPRTACGIEVAADDALSGRWHTGGVPPLWDGRAGSRIVDALLELRD